MKDELFPMLSQWMINEVLPHHITLIHGKKDEAGETCHDGNSLQSAEIERIVSDLVKKVTERPDEVEYITEYYGKTTTKHKIQ